MRKELFTVPTDRPGRTEQLKNCGIAYLLMMLVSIVSSYLILHFVSDAAIREQNFWFMLFQSRFHIDIFAATTKAAQKIQFPFLVLAFLTVVVAPLTEEILFRDWPLTHSQATVSLDPSRSAINARHLISTVFFSSIIFGILHGGVFNLFIQGIGGVILCWLYLKNRNSYWSTVTVHALYNLTITVMVATHVVGDTITFFSSLL